MTKISQFGLMEISRQRIGQSIYETFYQKCECCNGNGLKKTKSIIMHNLISLIKNLNFLEEKETFEIRIDHKFFKDNKNEIDKRIKALKLTFKIKFIETEKELEFKIYEIDKNLLEKIKVKYKENIEKNTVEEKTEKSYRRKIKKKTTEDIS